MATSFPIPGIFGNLLSLILLNINKNDDKYDGIIHYYRIIFLMDLIVVLISTFGLWALIINGLIDLKLWTPANDTYCKIFK